MSYIILLSEFLIFGILVYAALIYVIFWIFDFRIFGFRILDFDGRDFHLSNLDFRDSDLHWFWSVKMEKYYLGKILFCRNLSMKFQGLYQHQWKLKKNVQRQEIRRKNNVMKWLKGRLALTQECTKTTIEGQIIQRVSSIQVWEGYLSNPLTTWHQRMQREDGNERVQSWYNV